MPQGKRATLKEGHPTLPLLWKIRSGFTEIVRYLSLFNWWSSQSGKYSAGDSLSGFDFLISHLRLTSVKVGNQALRVA